MDAPSRRLCSEVAALGDERLAAVLSSASADEAMRRLQAAHEPLFAEFESHRGSEAFECMVDTLRHEGWEALPPALARRFATARRKCSAAARRELTTIHELQRRLHLVGALYQLIKGVLEDELAQNQRALERERAWLAAQPRIIRAAAAVMLPVFCRRARRMRGHMGTATATTSPRQPLITYMDVATHVEHAAKWRYVAEHSRPTNRNRVVRQRRHPARRPGARRRAGASSSTSSADPGDPEPAPSRPSGGRR